MQLSQLIESQCQMRASAVATIDAGQRRTWAETAERIARMGAALSTLGIERGDRVALLALNGHCYLEAAFAISWCGAVMVPLNTRLAAPEIRFMLEDAGAKAIFADDGFAELSVELAGELEPLKHVIHMSGGEAARGALAYEDLIAAAAPMPAVRMDGGDLAGLFYTGGTTGRSKGVMLSHDNLMINAMQGVTAMHVGRGKIYLHAAPMFHIADFVGMLMHLMRGGPHAFLPGFEPVAVMETMQREKVNLVLLIPTMIGIIVNHPRLAEYDLSSLEFVTYGGSPISEGVLKKTQEVLPGIKMAQAYGQTEAAPILSVLTPEWHVEQPGRTSKIRSGGRAVPGVELAILDEDDQPVALGVVGEICARGPNVMMGYWEMPEATQTALRNGWLHTGDGGYLDEDGFVFVADRVKDMIVSGGENVYSSEVESAISKFRGVVECAVIGVPDDKWGERVHAVVRLAEGVEASADDIIAHCHGLIGGFKCPKTVEFRGEPMPLSGAGKVLKRELRAPYWEGRDRAVG